jgi:PAS domain S-box-containing protein
MSSSDNDNDLEEERIRSSALQNAHIILLARRRAEEEMRKYSDLIRVTLASIGDAVISTNADGRVTFMNPVAESLTGWSQADAAGCSLTDIFRITNEQSRQPVENPASRALREGTIVGLASGTVLTAKDGSERPIDDSAAPIRDELGNVVGVVLVFRDISERMRQEAIQAESNRLVALRADISSSLAAGNETQGTLQACCAGLVLHLDVAFARIWTLNDDSDILELQASAGQYTHLDGAHSRIKVGEFKIGRIAANREPHLTNDTYNDLNVGDRDWARREKMQSFAGYPLQVDGRIVGVVAMFSRHPLTITILNDLEPLAAGIAQYIDRKRSEKLLREQHELFRITLESIGDAVISTDVLGRVTNINEVAQTLTGWGKADAIGKQLESVFQIVNETTRKPVENPAMRALAQGKIVGLANHTILLARNGSECAIDDSAAPIRSDKGEIVGCVLVFRDVTEARKAESALRESESFTRSVFEGSPDCVKVIDATGRLVQMNANGQCLMEIDNFSAVAGQYWIDLWPKESREVLQEALTSARERGLGHFEGHCPTAKGTLKWWDVVVAPIRGADGNVVRFVSVSRDMTERRQMEEALAENEERFRMLADNILQFAWMADAQGNLFWYNQRWYDYTGTTLDEMYGSGWMHVHHPDHLDRVAAHWQQSWQAGEVWEDTFPLRDRQGNYRWFLSRATPILDQSGKIARWFGTNTDITEHRELTDKLRNLAAELSEGDRRKNEFLAMLAHELRNPLAPIRNAVQLVQLSKGDANYAKLASEVIDRQVSHLVRLVDDLLDVSRISTGKFELRLDQVEISSIIQQAVETSRPGIEAAKHQLTMNLPSQPIYVQADAVRLAQVVSNLLNNSCKYSEPAGSILLTVEQQGRDVVVSVKDTGIGIATEMLPKVFDLFIQVDRSLDRAQGGLGIGLSLVQRIVEMHQGTVKVFSEGIGCGSEFVVRMPVFSDASQEISQQAAAKSSQLVARKILVVDDNRDSATSLSMLLKIVGHNTQTAYDGAAAIEVAEAFRPDVVLLDIGLPKLNGYEVARSIREQLWGARVLLIALTGWGQDKDREDSNSAGFNGHLVKPVDSAELLSLIAQIPPAAVFV